MHIVVIVDQISSRTRGVTPTQELRERLVRDTRIRATLPIAQSAGDELQAVVEDPDSLLRIVLEASRSPQWSIGVGVGPATLTAGEVHQSTGPAFYAARDAIELAKKLQWRICATGPSEWATRLGSALALWRTLLLRRTDEGWEAVDLTEQGFAVREIAARLQISQQAVTKRLRNAEWRLDLEARRLLSDLCALALHVGE